MTPPFWFRAGGPAWGCCLSHLAILQTPIADKLDSVFILEDDACFTEDAPEWLKLLVFDVPGDWQQIYLGGQHTRPPAPTASPRWRKATGVVRTHAYGVRGADCPEMCDFLQRHHDFVGRKWHIDHQFARGHFRGFIRAYAPAWWLAGQAAGVSSIFMRYVGRRWWQDESHSTALPFIHGVSADARGCLWFHPALDAARERRGALRSWIKQAAIQALKRGKLPAFCGVSPHEITRDWPAGVLELPDVAGDLWRLAAARAWQQTQLAP